MTPLIKLKTQTTNKKGEKETNVKTGRKQSKN